MPDVPDEEAVELVLRLLAIVDRTMPADQDTRILSAGALADN